MFFLFLLESYMNVGYFTCPGKTKPPNQANKNHCSAQCASLPTMNIPAGSGNLPILYQWESEGKTEIPATGRWAPKYVISRLLTPYKWP